MSVNQTKVSLSKIKYFKAGSHETECFTATVLFDGVPFATAENSGQGGMTFVLPLPTPKARSLMQAAEDFARALPPDVTDFEDSVTPGKKFEIQMNLEHLVNMLLADHLLKQDVKRAFLRGIKSNVLFVKNGLVYKCKLNGHPLDQCVAAVKARHGDVPVLNSMDQNKAIALYQEAVVAQT